MSFGAGGLAQMTYNTNGFNNGLGLPGSGYASRTKAGHNKRMSITPAISIPAADEVPAGPRTSRGHLLAGLRTAPRDGATTAPPTQLNFPGGLNDTRSAETAQISQQAASSAALGGQPQQNYQQSLQAPGRRGHQYTPSQVLAPPAIQLADENGEGMDPALYEELVRTNEYLAQQQLRLRQQLINVTAAAQQFQGLNMQQQQQYGAQMNAAMGFYGQQLQNGLQPVVEAVPGQPGLYLVYNPMTGQSGYFFDQSGQLVDLSSGLGMHDLSSSPPPPTPTFRVSSSPDNQVPKSQTNNNWRSSSPPKSVPTPPREEATPLPPPSANAFRPGHRKEMSLAGGLNQALSGDKNKAIQATASPQPANTGSFGPGHQREGEHPIRQPRGPPSLEEIMAKPTTKFEGSKNFATRQRRRAVHDLVRAGIDRRGPSATRSDVSSGSVSPTSDNEPTYSASSETDNDSLANGIAGISNKLNGNNTHRPLINRAIGSERKELKERASSGERSLKSSNSINGDDAGKAADGAQEDGEARKSTLSLLANANKRRNVVY